MLFAAFSKHPLVANRSSQICKPKMRQLLRVTVSLDVLRHDGGAIASALSRLHRIKAAVSEVDRPVDAKKREIEDVNQEDPVHRSKNDFGGYAAEVTEADEREKLPARPLCRPRPIRLPCVHGP